MISSKAVIHPGVRLGKDCVVEDFAVIGAPPAGRKPGGAETIIGDNALIRSHTVIYAGNVIGNDFQTGNKANIREGNVIGDNVSVGSLTVLEHSVRIGNNVRIHSQAFVPEFTVLEDDSWIGPCVVLTNAMYPDSPTAKQDLRGPVIKRNAKIGANATVLPGITIGEDALVGAGSVVTKDVQPGAVVAGNPARIINKVSELTKY